VKATGRTTNGEWPKVALDEVAELNPRLAEMLAADETVSFVPMSAVSAETAGIIDEETRTYAEVAKGYTSFVSGDVLVAKITPCFENGKIVQARLTQRAGFGSTEFHVIRPRANKLDARYTLHFLRLGHVRLAGERRMTGSAGQRRVPESFLAKLEIPLPPLVEQRRIAEILDRAEALRAKRRASFAELESLAQSIFLDLFGDPATNPKSWPIREIRDLLESATYGTSEKSGPVGEFPVLRMNNITRTGGMDFTDLKFMDLDVSQRERYLVRTGDVLFNRTNSADLVGKSAIFRETKQMAYAGYLVRLRVNPKSDPEYLSAFLNTGYAKRMLRGMCKSIIGMANINATEVQAMKIPLIPLPLQRDFSRRIQAMEKLKTVQRTSLAELDALFSTLQHRAFQGEL